MVLFSLIVSLISFILLIVIVFKKQLFQSIHVKDSIRELLLIQLKENREELSKSLKENREELSIAIERLTVKLEQRLDQINDRFLDQAKENRTELSQSLNLFGRVFTENVKEFNHLQKQQFEQMSVKQDQLVKATELKLETMRQMVEEKLHKTLEERLGQSFKLVSERLEAVQKGLGEMQHLASGVGDLKKVLSNVKTRGVLGEIQLETILEQIMAPEQYKKNIITKQGSNDYVEFAIVLPGREEAGNRVYLPIDAKFPQESYFRLQSAYNQLDKSQIEEQSKLLTQSIKRFAKTIKDKYLDPPNTTDFGIMFLPLEGLFAEVVRQPDLVTELQRNYKIILTGPTTLAAMLNSLQMGFKTLAIQKRSSEVWQILGAVKTEFGKFGQVLEKTQKKLNDANKDLDALIGTRTRMMLSKLKKIEQLPSSESMELLDNSIDSERENLVENS